jgi:hypothetical protein
MFQPLSHPTGLAGSGTHEGLLLIVLRGSHREESLMPHETSGPSSTPIKRAGTAQSGVYGMPFQTQKLQRAGALPRFVTGDIQ